MENNLPKTLFGFPVVVSDQVPSLKPGDIKFEPMTKEIAARAMEAFRRTSPFDHLPPQAPRLAICGPGRSGKDVAARTLAEAMGVPYRKSTSEAACDLVWRKWGCNFLEWVPSGLDSDTDLPITAYSDQAAMFADRSNHRTRWAEIIWAYNQPDGLRLYRDMIDGGETILCGIRRVSELQACKSAGLVDLAIWIERPGCIDSTCEIAAKDCDFSVLNCGSEEEFVEKLKHIGEKLCQKT